MTQRSFLLKINQKINDHALNYSHPYITFAIFGMITYPLYYFLWAYSESTRYENLPLRIVAALLCAGLALKNYWPKKAQQFFPLYWYGTLLYCLPLLFTFLLLKNNMSYAWALNTMTVLVLATLLLDLFALTIILSIGIFLGVCLYLLSGATLTLQPTAMPIFITYGSIVFFGALFSYRKDQLKEAEKKMALVNFKWVSMQNSLC